MAKATKQWEKYTPEDPDEPTYDLSLTMREMGILIYNTPIGNSYDGYSVGWTVHQKLMRGMQALANRADSRLVEKMMDGPVGVEGQKGE